MRPLRWPRKSRLMARPVFSFTRSDCGAAPSGHPPTGAAGADVLPVNQSHHSLERIYLELISQNEEAHHR
jgi:hypothetical protein